MAAAGDVKKQGKAVELFRVFGLCVGLAMLPGNVEAGNAGAGNIALGDVTERNAQANSQTTHSADPVILLQVRENIPDAPEELRQSLARYQATRSALLGGWAADGKGMFVITGYGETPQIHFLEDAETDDKQLTFFDDPVNELAPSPADPNLVAFTLDSGGNETYQIYLLDRESDEITPLSDPYLRSEGILWSTGGNKIAWRTINEDGTRSIIATSLDRPGENQILLTGDGSWLPMAWAHDEATLLVRRYVSINESTLHLLDVDTGSMQQVNPSSKPISYRDAAFSSNGRHLFYTSDEAGEFLDLFRLTLATGKKINLTKRIDWDVEDIETAPKGGKYAFVVNQDGKSRLYIRSSVGTPQITPALPAGRVRNMRFKPDGRWLAFTLDAAAAPADVYSVRVSRRIKRLQRWTQSASAGLDEEGFIEPRFFEYKTFDEYAVNSSRKRQRKIPALIYRPPGRGPHPVVIDIHGGPEVQARPSFSSQHQFWVKELGLAVIRPNIRGSSGYGKSYLKLDNGMKRADAIRDIGALLDWIADQRDLDPNRVVVYGSSYGGYVSLASMIKYSDRLSGGVDVFGISNFVSFLENTAGYRQNLRRAEYGDERDPEMRQYLEAISPLNDANKISKPILIIQGANDPRVPASESDQIVKAIRENGGEVWYLLAMNEGHGFKRRANRDAASEATAMFLIDALVIE